MVTFHRRYYIFILSYAICTLVEVSCTNQNRREFNHHLRPRLACTHKSLTGLCFYLLPSPLPRTLSRFLSFLLLIFFRPNHTAASGKSHFRYIYIYSSGEGEGEREEAVVITNQTYLGLRIEMALRRLITEVSSILTKIRPFSNIYTLFAKYFCYRLINWAVRCDSFFDFGNPNFISQVCFG